MDALLLRLARPIEGRVARRLRVRQPGWKKSTGACPACLHEAVQHANAERSADSLHRELQVAYPIFARDEARRLLPTPLRVRAHPHYTGHGVTIAFLDSGFYPHPDLVRPHNRIVCYADATGSETIEKENFRRADVASWHGLMTTCVGAGTGFMSDGLYHGPARGANLVLVKTGNRRGRRIRENDIFRALLWTIYNRERFNIRVVNISLGGDMPSIGAYTYLDALVEEAVAQGMVVVAAAGNSGREAVFPPASAPSVITVGGVNDQNSIDPARRRMWHSNYGRGVVEVPKPDLIAPAIWLAAPMLPHTATHNEAKFLWELENLPDQELQHFVSTRYAEIRFRKETLRKPLKEVRRVIRAKMIAQKFIHPHYQHVDGTSMAAPLISGVVAQMLEANPNLTPAKVKELLTATADPLEDVDVMRQGAGVVNGARAVAAALRAAGGALAGLPTSPHITPEGVTFYYHNDSASEVAIVGSFNRWQTRRGKMHRLRAGVWKFFLPLPEVGQVYPYKFVVNHTRWVNDPENPNIIEDGCGGFYSLLEV